MSRFDTMFAAKKKVLGVYLTVGDPSPEMTTAAATAAIDAGADFIELGAPFSDPSADGPSIQRAMERAIAGGTKFSHVAACARAIRAHSASTPIVLFGYANPYFRALKAGALAELYGVADGVLLVDVPPEHDHDFAELSGKMACIRLLGPNATPERRKAIAARAEGFIYVVAYAGVTGAGAHGDAGGLGAQVDAMRALTQVPLCVGFGVRTGEDAKRLARVGDGVIAGSVFVDALSGVKSASEAAQKTAAVVRDLRAGLDA